ncbi:MAG: YceI family protein [Bacteroidia bacterium]|nr:YceI family protein [Bacteroidia bacterium]MBT8278203.1 YceI family protein [Bacteroidia bacterium]NNK58999.1 YceI family protein [Flavobacteriaceae bacterium]NNL32124.1 YceI family protein [Flavobacteriaceae bacterium]
MNSLKSLTLLILLSLFINAGAIAQSLKLDQKQSSLIVSGTSSLHDWDVNATEFSGSIAIQIDEAVVLSKLKVVVTAESLKSGKNGMDKNTYRALKTDEFGQIVFKMTKVNAINKVKDAYYEVGIIGDLTIAGVTRSIHLRCFLQTLDKKVLVMGNIELRMTEFDIEPPKALLGTIKTGDLINIKFNTIFE